MFIPQSKVFHVLKLFMIGIMMSGFLFNSVQVKAEDIDSVDIKVLVVFSSDTGEMDEHQRLLNMLLGHFTTNMSFKSISEVKETDVEQVTHLFYYGHIEERLPTFFPSLIESYTGTIVALGYNVEQLGNHFSFIEPIAKEQMNEIALVSDKDKKITFAPNIVLNIDVSEETEILVKGRYGEKEYPLFVKNKRNYYYASSDIRPPSSIFIAEALHDVFEEEHTNSHPAYIRLEDIHPLVDPTNMMQIAEILKEKSIPYMIAVIPVYTNPETGKQNHFSDSPNLLKVLKYMQDNGGSIVLHGYTHQFRTSETGEGFEFWDVEHNKPIYHQQDEKVDIKTRQDFDSAVKYQEYLAGQKAYEREYIQTKLTRGIQELTNYGLYPLAFEAPHYTMSQHGYEVTSEHFSTYSGQLQVSDRDWVIMTTAPYITRPTFLNGMELLPETMGYVKPGDPNAIEKMLKRAHDYQMVRDGMVAGFYHPYLGVEGFIELILEMEKIPDISWIDLKQRNNTVRADNIEIKSHQGEIIARVNHGQLFMSSVDFLTYHIRTSIEKVTWAIAVIGAIAVILFIYNIIILRIHEKIR